MAARRIRADSKDGLFRWNPGAAMLRCQLFLSFTAVPYATISAAPCMTLAEP